MNYIFICLHFIFLLFSCQNGNKIPENQYEKNGQIDIVEIVSAIDTVTHGDIIKLEWQLKNETQIADSFELYIDYLKDTCLSGNAIRVDLNSGKYKIGNRNIKIKAYTQKGFGQASSKVVIVSNIVPKKYTFKIIRTLPHSRETYTQGLVYRDGFFYESAGEYGESALKKVKVETGEVISMASLESNIFAEGIAIKDNEIYQISWKERVCIVYDMLQLQQKRRFTYNINEGWGLEFNGSNFLMTDGSNALYFLDPEYFSIIKKIEVMDQNGPVNMLNELELINGVLYANVYTTNMIVMIDPESGKVIGELDLKGILADTDRKPETDVLNGIAFDPQTSHLFVTGKKWPKLFEIAIK